MPTLRWHHNLKSLVFTGIVIVVAGTYYAIALAIMLHFVIKYW